MELHENFFYSAIVIENVLVHHILIARAMFSYSLDDPETKRIKVQSHSKKTVSFFIVSSTCRWPRNQSSVSSWVFLAGSRHLMIKLHVYHLVYVGYVLISFFWQQLRKLLLEILHRIPTNEHLRPHFQVHFTTEMLKKGYMYMYYCSHGNLYRVM